jgi:hypothetical protein
LNKGNITTFEASNTSENLVSLGGISSSFRFIFVSSLLGNKSDGTSRYIIRVKYRDSY